MNWIEKMWTLIISAKTAEGELGKAWYRSKTLWLNFLTIVGALVATKYGFSFGEAELVFALGLVNIILRLITKEPTGFIDTK
jgi:L-asparagine transporter-like permease